MYNIFVVFSKKMQIKYFSIVRCSNTILGHKRKKEVEMLYHQ